MAYDAFRQRVVMFGPSATPPYLRETWEWDGANWMLRASFGPEPYQPCMTYDPVRRRVVLYTNDVLWEWDGFTWLMQRPVTVPSIRTAAAMASDAARGRVVMFGGRSINQALLAETWEWDGTNWALRLPGLSPSARQGHSMTYDPISQRVLLFGGADDTRFLADTWAWDGNTWTPIPNGPGARAETALTFHEAHQRAVLFGGTVRPSYDVLSDTWTFGALVPALATPIGLACAGGSLPVLTSSQPALGAPLVLDLLSARVNSPCVYGFSAQTQSRPIGRGCVLYLGDPIVPLVTQTNSAGFATLRFTVPMERSLRGASLYSQGFIVDASSSPLGLAFTAGRRLLFGD
jgi:hypothetical protein